MTTSAIVPGFDSNSFVPADDGSTGLVSLGFDHPINFLGQSYSSVYINNNGNLTFNAPLPAYTPFSLAADNGTPIIAPFFADVWTVGNSGVVQYGSGTVDGHQAFGATWPAVSYYDNSDSDKLNTFQVILIDRSDTGVGNFDIEFNYGSIQWESGDKSGGVNGVGGLSARAGYSNGTGQPGTFFELPGSGVNRAFLDSNHNTGLIHNDLNSSVPGRYVFAIRIPPSGIDLSNTTIPESSRLGTVVGNLTTIAPSGGQFSYSLVGGDTNAFAISANQLVTAAPFDFASKHSYGVTIRSANDAGQYVDQEFDIAISEVAPQITLASTARATAGQAFTLPGSFALPGPGAPAFTATVDYGDNGQPSSPADLPSLAITGSNPYSFTLQHVYNNTGDFTVSVYLFRGTQMVASGSTIVHVITAQQANEIVSSDTEQIPPQGVGSAQATGVGDNGIQATLKLTGGNESKPATLWVVNYKGDPTSDSDSTATAQGTIQISQTGGKAAPLAFYDLRVSGVPGSDTQSLARVTYTFAVPASSVHKNAAGEYTLAKSVTILFFNGQSWQPVKGDPAHPAKVTIARVGSDFIATVTLTYDALSTPNLAGLNGTVITAALPAAPPPAPTPVPVTVSSLSAYPTLPTANFSSSSQATVIFRVSQVNELSSSTRELSTSSASSAVGATDADESDPMQRVVDIDWLMRLLDGSRNTGGTSQPRRNGGAQGANAPQANKMQAAPQVQPAAQQSGPADNTPMPEEDVFPERLDNLLSRLETTAMSTSIASETSNIWPLAALAAVTAMNLRIDRQLCQPGKTRLNVEAFQDRRDV